MFPVVLAFVTAIVTASHVTAQIPSYIHVCGLRDPNIHQCILNNVNNMKQKICQGIPELDIPSNDPLHIDKIVIVDTDRFKLDNKDVQITGLCDFDINSLRVDMDKFHFDVNLSFQRIYMNSTYHFEINILEKVVGNGLIYITTDNVSADATMDIKTVTNGGKKYLYMSKIRINLNITNFDAQYKTDLERRQIQEIVSNFVGNNQEDIIKSFKPLLEKEIAKIILSVSNNIVKHFTYEELFPDRV